MPSKTELLAHQKRLESRLNRLGQEIDEIVRKVNEDVDHLNSEVFPHRLPMISLWDREVSEFDNIKRTINKQFKIIDEKLDLLAADRGLEFTEESANYALVKKEKK